MCVANRKRLLTQIRGRIPVAAAPKEPNPGEHDNIYDLCWMAMDRQRICQRIQCLGVCPKLVREAISGEKVPCSTAIVKQFDLEADRYGGENRYALMGA